MSNDDRTTSDPVAPIGFDEMPRFLVEFLTPFLHEAAGRARLEAAR